MKVSYNWLQEYFNDKLPAVEDLTRGLTFHAFEIDGVEQVQGDKIIDVDVLPNRASDCLSHNGIASEISAIFDLPIKTFPESLFNLDSNITSVGVKVETDLCSRYIGVKIENIKIAESPDWLKSGLENLGQRSINNLVDATNFCLLMFGQPLHAFDADKVAGGITVRLARDGEEMITLDNKELKLDSTMVVIADDEGVLALAGIKGGKKAEVTEVTKNVILESANFSGLSVRKTAQKVGIRTDASKRFENGLAVELAEKGMRELIGMILKFNPEAKNSDLTDIGSKSEVVTTVTLPVKLVGQRLGVEIDGVEITKLLNKINIKTEIDGDHILATVPAVRLDLRLPEDLIEEVGRLYGYEKITSVDLPVKKPEPHASSFLKTQTVRVKLLPLGFSEIYNRTFADKGEVFIANPLAKDKPYLRTNLSDGMIEKIEFNLKNVLFDDKSVKIFEVGTAFPKVGEEEMRVVIGVGYTKAKFHTKSEDIKKALETLGLSEGDVKISKSETMTVAEFGLSKIAEGDFADLKSFVHPDTIYKRFSVFPRIIRDIALFVPEGTTPESVAEIIKENAGDLCVRGPILFDEFHKDGKVSLAYRLVFQSPDRTLSDDETNQIMEKIITELEKNTDFEVRK